MKIYEERGKQRVKWREDGKQHSKSFATLEEAELFCRAHGELGKAAREEPKPEKAEWDPKDYASRMTDRGRKPWVGGSVLEYDLPARPHVDRDERRK